MAFRNQFSKKIQPPVAALTFRVSELTCHILPRGWFWLLSGISALSLFQKIPLPLQNAFGVALPLFVRPPPGPPSHIFDTSIQRDEGHSAPQKLLGHAGGSVSLHPGDSPLNPNQPRLKNSPSSSSAHC